MNYLTTYTNDPQTVKWMLPDPAEQFHNSYLAMGNNPVSYVDPDGEFAMLFAIAGFSIGMMGTAMHADNNGINLTGGDLLMAGARWGAVAAGVYTIASVASAAAAGGAAAKGAVAAKGAGAVKLGSKAFLKAGLKGGAINTLSNYNFDNGFKDIGFGTFLDFSAGFLGAATGVQANSKLIGMGVGGALNMGFNAEQDDGVYEYAQGFVGGALSSYGGMGKYAKGKKLFSKAKWKNAEIFLKYGAQSTAYDFAYSEKKYFTTRHWYEHVGMFATGGAAGVGIDKFFTGTKYELGSMARVGFGASIYAAEWMITSRIKYGSYARYNGYDPGGFYTGRSQKAKGWVSGFKWALPSYNFIFGR